MKKSFAVVLLLALMTTAREYVLLYAPTLGGFHLHVLSQLTANISIQQCRFTILISLGSS